jgi:hypothetical protein
MAVPGAIRKTDQDNHQEQVLEMQPDNADFVDCAPRRQSWRKTFNLASRGMLEVRNFCI